MKSRGYSNYRVSNSSKMDISDIDLLTRRGPYFSPKMPIQVVSIRPSKVRVYLNALTEDCHFLSKNLVMKISDINELDMPRFLLYCQAKFEARSTLKYVFGADGM